MVAVVVGTVVVVVVVVVVGTVVVVVVVGHSSLSGRMASAPGGWRCTLMHCRARQTMEIG